MGNMCNMCSKVEKGDMVKSILLGSIMPNEKSKSENINTSFQVVESGPKFY